MPGDRIKLNTPEAFSEAMKLNMKTNGCPKCGRMLVHDIHGTKCYACGWTKERGEDGNNKSEKHKNGD